MTACRLVRVLTCSCGQPASVVATEHRTVNSQHSTSICKSALDTESCPVENKVAFHPHISLGVRSLLSVLCVDKALRSKQQKSMLTGFK